MNAEHVLIAVSFGLLITMYMFYRTEAEGRQADVKWYQEHLADAEARLNHARHMLKSYIEKEGRKSHV